MKELLWSRADRGCGKIAKLCQYKRSVPDLSIGASRDCHACVTMISSV